MNSQFQYKLLQTLNKKNRNKGFTLIELLVVVIIIGVLAAIALPNLLGQVAKGRQAEARNNLGVVNRGQQAYRLENATFAPIASLPVTTTTTYYQAIADVGTASPVSAEHSVTAQTTYTNDILDYGSAVSQQSNGTYAAVICEQTTNPNTAVTAGSLTDVGTATSDAVCNTSARTVK